MALHGSQVLAEWDWVDSHGARVLHHVADGDFDEDKRLIYHPRFTCGRMVTVAYIPGIFTRMGAKRCDRCCDRLGYPRGKGSPRNDPKSRALADARVDAIPNGRQP